MPVNWHGEGVEGGLFEVPASSAVMLLVPLEIAGGQDTEPLFLQLPGSDEALFSKARGGRLQVVSKEVFGVAI